ncbi:MAG: CBS domain-containing protein [Planctomycetota bacterium]
MSRFPLEIDRYMSSVVVLIDPSQPLAEAIRLMRLHDVRHLPVVAKNRVVGLISQRDVYLVQSLAPADPSQILVSEAMTRDPYAVDPEESVYRVAREMVRRRISSAVVAHGGRLRGLFTTTDALLALAALVEDERVPGEESAPASRNVPASRKRSPSSGSAVEALPREKSPKPGRRKTRPAAGSTSK